MSVQTTSDRRILGWCRDERQPNRQSETLTALVHAGGGLAANRAAGNRRTGRTSSDSSHQRRVSPRSVRK